MPRRRRGRREVHRDAGETLVEIVMTVVIIGIAVTALVSGLATTATAGNTNRTLATADAVMRSYAEAWKDAAADCVAGAPLTAVSTPPDGFTTTVVPPTPTCPPATATSALVLDVSGPDGVHQTMQIVIRTP